MKSQYATLKLNYVGCNLNDGRLKMIYTTGYLNYGGWKLN